MDQATVENRAYMAIFAVANLADHFRKWARENGKDPERVEKVVKSSRPVQLIIDLANHEKHGGFDRKGGYSKLNPRLRDLRRGVALVRDTPGETVVTFSFDGNPPIIEENGGRVGLAIDAKILSKDRVHLGNLQATLQVATAAWETLWKEYSESLQR